MVGYINHGSFEASATNSDPSSKMSNDGNCELGNLALWVSYSAAACVA